MKACFYEPRWDVILCWLARSVAWAESSGVSEGRCSASALYITASSSTGSWSKRVRCFRFLWANPERCPRAAAVTSPSSAGAESRLIEPTAHRPDMIWSWQAARSNRTPEEARVKYVQTGPQVIRVSMYRIKVHPVAEDPREMWILTSVTYIILRITYLVWPYPLGTQWFRSLKLHPMRANSVRKIEILTLKLIIKFINLLNVWCTLDLNYAL